MLFNSYTFILIFLPATFCVYHGLRRLGRQRAAIASLACASLFFYGWWNPRYLVLLLALIVANFAAARWLMAIALTARKRRLLALAVGVGGNLAVLGYFKYANFLVDNLNAATGFEWTLATIVLPLGISFFTFQKIALLVDTFQGKVRQLDFLDYVLFVSFFPQLIAGPIVHHSEVMPQFRTRGRVSSEMIGLGLMIFIIGLCKKVLLADELARYVAPVFDAAATAGAPSAWAAWAGALAYALQLYFDFSGYSDMAIGGALLFGIRLPLNFASPYKADSIIDFWRRWHVTLSRFLRDYLYIPLGGNRDGRVRRFVNLGVTMLLGGLWHGAAWTFVVWGALHGAYLITNHGWRALRARIGGVVAPSAPGRIAARALTFCAVIIAWVPFRADDLASAFAMLRAMAGANGLGSFNDSPELGPAWLLIVPLLALVWLAPNTQQITGYLPPAGPAPEPIRLPAWLRWRPSPRFAVAGGLLLAVAFLSLSKVSEFIYFQF
jgi:D-alanyl-lipoteichoic acid acyltransferase DltB (MBOAT superfamily)